ncbi:MAG: hypothetical protein ACLP9L_31460 [Thermoguttaceae bacterium]
MRVFTEMASVASSRLLGASAEGRISNEELAQQMAQMALNDPELAAHYARMAGTARTLRVQRAREDAEWSVESPRSDGPGLSAEAKRRAAGETTPTAKAAPR